MADLAIMPDRAPVLCYHRNQQYSVTALTNSSGTITERYAYSAYGQPTIMSGSGTVLASSAEANRITYTGREWDEDLELYHYRARMYDPLSGRFCSRDPIGLLSGDENLYRIVFNRPLIAVDPSGNACVFTVVLGHADFVRDTLLGKPGFPELPPPRKCERIGVLCCYNEGGMRWCKKIRGEDNVIPNWPVMKHPNYLWCEKPGENRDPNDPEWRDGDWLVPDIWLKARKAMAEEAKKVCKDNECDCKRVQIKGICDQEMSDCMKRLKKEGKVFTNPCGRTINQNC